MIYSGMLLAVLSGICNGLFSAPMKLENRWKWENIWFGFIIVSCVLMPLIIVSASVPGWLTVFSSSPGSAVVSAIVFGFLWGFGAICFGRSVDRLGVSVANSLVIGLSSALGSLVPLLMKRTSLLAARELVLFAGIGTFIVGVAICGKGGRLRDGGTGQASPETNRTTGYIFAAISGIMSAIFNIGYTLALPISDVGVSLGHSRFAATNCIWLLMLGAGSIPNLVYCLLLMKRNGTAKLLFAGAPLYSWTLSVLMGLLWGGSIFIYGAATPRLGDLGTSVGWSLSLAVGLLVANLMGLLLGEWNQAPRRAINFMRTGIALLLFAIVLCAVSTRMGA